MKRSTLLYALLLNSIITFAQLDIVHYQIEFNEATNLYDCKMYIEGGSATTVSERLQRPSQYSIVVETGTNVAVHENYLPIYDNDSYFGIVPVQWLIDKVAVDPVELPGYDVIGIVPYLLEQAHYNDMVSGDFITLFSLSVNGGDICDLRLFENGEDPSNIGGMDFNNSMEIGTTNELYKGNYNGNNSWNDVDITISENSICIGEFTALTPNEGVIWESTNESTATIDNNGNVV